MSTAADTGPHDPAGTAAYAPVPAEPGPIVARAGRYFRNARYIMVLVCLAMGGWFAYDGWVKYPRQNAEDRAKGFEKVRHSDFDIRLQRILAGTLPVLGLFILVRMLHRSRGEYRLDGNTLYVPGHPPVPLENIREIDKTQWDRKGIVHLTYEVPGRTETRSLTLDDFVYDQKPTDAILERIEAVLVPPTDEAAADVTEPAEDQPSPPVA